MPTHDVRLKIGNIAYGGWQQIEVTRTIEAISGSFKLGVSEKWPGQQSRFAIKRGSACSVTIDGKSIITGYIDEVEPTYDKGEHSVSFSGRDKTGDLVDSSAIATPGTWIGTGLMPIVQQLVAKFGIPVVANVDLGRVFDGFSLQQGESVFEAIERLCARRGVLPVSDGQGGLILTRAGSGGANTTLKLGVNVLKARGTYDDKQRFSKYIMLGQSAGSDYVDPSVTVGPHAEATDPGISRYRPLIVFVPLTDVANSLQDRANWEASVRAGRATKAVLTVQGWTDAAGQLWHPNGMVHVDDDWLALHDTLLISGVKFMLSADSGTTTELTVTKQEAFALAPITAGTDYDPRPDTHIFPPSTGKGGQL